MDSFCLFLIYKSYLETDAVQPWSHSLPIDNKPDVFITGNKRRVQALGGKDGIFNDRMCVEIIDPPLGSNAIVGLFAIGFCVEFIPV